MMSLFNNIEKVKARLESTAAACRRSPKDITLLAVSKTRSTEMIKQAVEFGIQSFGENYLQEALPKIIELQSLKLDWHFIGPIQSNKTRQISENFSWVHSVDRVKIAHRLNDQRPANMQKLNVCIQVNIDNEPSKSGFKIEEVDAAVRDIINLPNLQLRGLMAIPRTTDKFDTQRKPLAKLRKVMDKINYYLENSNKLDTLSMGMSSDLEAAIFEQATIVRVGSDIFGARISK
jgi:pyridoxal phosphate enzyme (YggS family)